MPEPVSILFWKYWTKGYDPCWPLQIHRLVVIWFSMTEKFIIGTVGAPFGVNGFLKVHSSSGEIQHLLLLKSVIVCKDGKEQLLHIEESSPRSEGSADILIHFTGFNNPEAAKTLTGAQLLAGREQAAPLGDGEFFIEDLKSLPVLSDKAGIIGHVTDIIEGGGGELVEIQLASGEKRLVPFRKEFFTDINLDESKIILSNLWILE